MASGDLVFEVDNCPVDLNLFGQPASANAQWVVSFGSGQVPDDGASTARVGLVNITDGVVGGLTFSFSPFDGEPSPPTATPFDSAKTYDIKITEH